MTTKHIYIHGVIIDEWREGLKERDITDLFIFQILPDQKVLLEKSRSELESLRCVQEVNGRGYINLPLKLSIKINRSK